MRAIGAAFALRADVAFLAAFAGRALLAFRTLLAGRPAFTGWALFTTLTGVAFRAVDAALTGVALVTLFACRTGWAHRALLAGRTGRAVGPLDTVGPALARQAALTGHTRFAARADHTFGRDLLDLVADFLDRLVQRHSGSSHVALNGGDDLGRFLFKQVGHRGLE